MKILIIDDDQSLATILSTALQSASYQTVTANTGKEGIDKASSEKPDLILLDQILPDIAGNDVLRTLKANQDTSNIPVAMMSNYSDENIMKNAISLGAIDYIYKYNIEPKDLIQKVALLTKPPEQSAAPSE